MLSEFRFSSRAFLFAVAEAIVDVIEGGQIIAINLSQV
jgi:hypothetical protein